MQIDAACFSMGFLDVISIMTTNASVSHDLTFPCTTWNTSQTLISSPEILWLQEKQKQHVPLPVLSHVVLAAWLSDLFVPCQLAIKQDRSKLLLPCSPSLTQNAHWGLHPLSKPWFSLLYRNFLSLISLPFYPVWLMVASGFRSCRQVCKWGRKERTEHAVWQLCSRIGCKISHLQKNATQDVGFVCTTFTSKRMWRKISHMGWMCCTNSWPTGRCSGSNTMKIWGICGKLWACQYGICHQP